MKGETSQTIIRGFKVGGWILVAGFVLLGAIPAYYPITAKLPPLGEVRMTEGHILLKNTGKRGYMIGVRTAEGNAYFTCSPALGLNHDSCSRKLTRRKFPDQEGRYGRFWWFEQSIYPFVTQQRLLRIEIEGQEILSYQEIQEDLTHDRAAAIWGVIGYFCFLALPALGFYLQLRRVDHEAIGDRPRFPVN